MTIAKDASCGVNKLKASLNYAARGVIYERHMFIVQATGAQLDSHLIFFSFLIVSVSFPQVN